MRRARWLRPHSPCSSWPLFVGQVTGSGSGRWPLWSEANIAVRSGSPPVALRIPEAWRGRVGMAFGDRGIVVALRVGHCPAAGRWSLWAGGFYVRSPTCAPVKIAVGARSRTVRFGVGRHCPAAGSAASSQGGF